MAVCRIRLLLQKCLDVTLIKDYTLGDASDLRGATGRHRGKGRELVQLYEGSMYKVPM